ncbi:hypothetical protein FAZ15_18025 [Sphingobacterium olei]|uniref:Adenylosuccinate lyase n=1 Tax=Sphingobacterium olei TaxID=2571155 RepID=A0A4U0NGG5_9SPHI|nr:hypothetical protein [Sphingobacterium olei]TJZ53255.1 hypothetical protein FAZ15_18025 [Sphingobacterium olei]
MKLTLWKLIVINPLRTNTDLKNYEEISETLLKIRVSEVSSSIFELYPLDGLFSLSLQADDKQIAFRAAWIIETIFLREPHYFTDYTQRVIDAYIQTNNWSCLRSYTKLVMWILSSKNKSTSPAYDQRKVILEKTFACLLDLTCPIAVKANCFDILFYLENDEDWIKEELTAQLHICISENPTPAIKSRGNRILKKLKRITNT